MVLEMDLNVITTSCLDCSKYKCMHIDSARIALLVKQNDRYMKSNNENYVWDARINFWGAKKLSFAGRLQLLYLVLYKQ